MEELNQNAEVNQVPGPETDPALGSDQKEARTFTQEELNKFVSERVKRERAKYADYEELKEKALKFDEITAAQGTELTKLQEESKKLKEELKSMKEAEQLRLTKEKIAKDSNIPLELLTEKTEEALLNQAAALANYIKQQPGYPVVKDGGEVSGTGARTTAQAFDEWMKKAL